MAQTPKYKKQKYITFGRKHVRNLQDAGFDNGFLGHDTKTQAAEKKTNS